VETQAPILHPLDISQLGWLAFGVSRPLMLQPGRGEGGEGAPLHSTHQGQLPVSGADARGEPSLSCWLLPTLAAY
jgi:hypothetical protein